VRYVADYASARLPCHADVRDSINMPNILSECAGCLVLLPCTDVLEFQQMQMRGKHMVRVWTSSEEVPFV